MPRDLDGPTRDKRRERDAPSGRNAARPAHPPQSLRAQRGKYCNLDQVLGAALMAAKRLPES